MFEDFAQRLASRAGAIERRLDALLSPDAQKGEIMRPARLLDAMRYATLGGGKRLRPFLVDRDGAAVRRAGDSVAARRLRRSNACIAIRSSTTTCPAWTTTICAAAGRPSTRPSTRRPRSWPATRCSPGLRHHGRRADPSRRRSARRARASASRAPPALGGMAGGQMLDLDAETAPDAARRAAIERCRR